MSDEEKSIWVTLELRKVLASLLQHTRLNLFLAGTRQQIKHFALMK